MAFLHNSQNVINNSKVISAANLTVIAGSTESYIEIKTFVPPPMYGTVAGFISGGVPGTPTIIYNNEIQRFPFASDANATDYGDLTEYVASGAGQSSTSHGYRAGGFLDSFVSGVDSSNVIDKFPFASAANATDVGDITQSRYYCSGQSSPTNGYTSGGSPPLTPSNVIDKFPFAADGNATDVGDLTGNLSRPLAASGQSSLTHGYVSGVKTPFFRDINKFPFASDSNATSIGTLADGFGGGGSGQSSLTHGYNSGSSYSSPTLVRTRYIEKFPFATDTNATKVGDLIQPLLIYSSGQSSTTHGYVSGGGTDVPLAGPIFNTIQKFPFATDSNSSYVGDLVRAMKITIGTQD